MPSHRHIVIAGDAADRLFPLVAALRQDGATVTRVPDAGDLPHLPVTTFLLAEHFSAGMEWDRWWHHDAHNRDAFHTVLPYLAASSNGMLVGFGDTGERSERAEIRAGMKSLLALFHAHAAADRAVEFSMNGIEVPLSHDADLLARRLGEYTSRRSLLANEIVIRFDDLIDQSIAQATTNSFI
ncbi:MAG: hypothetical protein K0S37_3252 [Microbacterium sp.]|jgi:hypothetical protein|nr:hypothetical protein [Microbacterium sp.]